MSLLVLEKNKLAIDGGTPCVVDAPSSYLHGPQEIGDEEIKAVTDVLRSKNLFRFMKEDKDSPTAQFEAEFKRWVGTEYVLAMNSGTSALIAGMIGLGISSGDEVIVPAYTYIATAAAVLAVRAIPVIAEIDDSLTINPEDIERKITPRTKLIIPVHMRGVACQMDKIMALAKKHQVKVLEDCAQNNGGTYKGQPVGSIGDVGIFSLQHFKIITAGEGGFVVTNQRHVFERAACYHDSAYTFWKEEQWSIEPFLGENYRMSELHGALGLAQLRKRDGILNRTRAIKKKILEGIMDLPGIQIQKVPDPAGDCGIALTFLMDTSEHAAWFAKALTAEGMAAGSIFDKGIPNRHIFCHWDYILKKRTPDMYGYPWQDPNRPCHMEYSPEMCPETLSYLNRTVTLSITQVMSDPCVDSCIHAIRKVHAHLSSL